MLKVTDNQITYCPMFITLFSYFKINRNKTNKKQMKM